MTNETKTGTARKPVASLVNNETTNKGNSTMTNKMKDALTSDQIALCESVKTAIAEGVEIMLDEFAAAKVKLADLIDGHAIAMDTAGIDADTIGKILNEATKGVCEPQHVSARLCKLNIRRRATKALPEAVKANIARAEKAVHKHTFCVADAAKPEEKPVVAADCIGKYENCDETQKAIVRAYFAAM